MATEISKFIAQCTSDNVRANNQYELMATSGINEVDAVLQRAVMFCSNATLPNRSINYGSVHYKGYECKGLVPLNLVMGNEVTLNVKADVNGEYRRAFLAWMNSVMNCDISGGSVFEGDRGMNEKSIIRVMLFDKDNKTVCETYKFYNVRITDVGAMELTYEGGDVANFGVTFSCTYWEIESAKNGALTNQK